MGITVNTTNVEKSMIEAIKQMIVIVSIENDEYFLFFGT
jgi:hypothetical protein